MALEAVGHTTIEAADGIEALKSSPRKGGRRAVVHPDASDGRLPAVPEIRTNDRLRDLPIIKKPAPVETILTALHEAIAM